jgi:hypothetical protein
MIDTDAIMVTIVFKFIFWQCFWYKKKHLFNDTEVFIALQQYILSFYSIVTALTGHC